MTEGPDYKIQGAKSRLAEASTYIPGGPPWLALNDAAGSWVYDMTGSRFLDFGPGGFVATLGHRYSSPTYAIQEHLSHYLSAVPVDEVAALYPGRYARTLSERFPPVREEPRQVLVCSGVTEARRVARVIGATEAGPPMEITPISAATTLDAGMVADMMSRAHDRSRVVIADETVTGFGRTGKFLGIHHYDGVVPDIVLLGPGGGGGLPFAAVVAPREMFSRLDAVEVGGFSPLVAAAAYGVLVAMTPILMDHVTEQGTLLTEKVNELRDQFSVVVSGSTGVGLLQKIQLTDQRLSTPFHLKCRAKGLIMAPDLVLTPPLTVSADEISAAVDVMADALMEMQEEER